MDNLQTTQIGAVTFVNLTPHSINFLGNEIKPSGTIARCDEVVERLDTSIPQVRITMGHPENVPMPCQGTIYIASRLVAEKLKRADVMSPAELVRDEQGRVIGCSALARFDE